MGAGAGKSMGPNAASVHGRLAVGLSNQSLPGVNGRTLLMHPLATWAHASQFIELIGVSYKIRPVVADVKRQLIVGILETKPCK